MDAIGAISSYIDRMISDPKIEGMKVLLLDNETTQIISMVMSQSAILAREVFLVQNLTKPPNQQQPMKHMKAVVFVRPTSANMALLAEHLNAPVFGSYHLFFSNVVSADAVEKLATKDSPHQVVQTVQEYYSDFLAVNPDFFHLNVQGAIRLSKPKKVTTAAQQQQFNRTVEGVLAVCLSMKKKPIVRYQSGSDVSRQVANEVTTRMLHDGLFDFRRPEVAPILLILDRKDDPVTPLLSQWCYQSMVHELLGLFENRVNLRGAPGVKKEMEEVVLSVTSDSFFKQHMGSNFGDLGSAVKDLVDKYQQKAQTHESIQSIEDMQRFLENYPAFRSQSLNVSKHVTLLGELSRLMDVQCLMDVSQLEQELACNDDHATQWKELLQRLRNGRILPANKLRLAMLYALRYEVNSSNQIQKVKKILLEEGLSQSRVSLIDTILAYGGVKSRSGDLYGDRGFKKIMRAVTKGLQGVPNVYAQHIPPLIRTLDSLSKNQCSEQEFPYAVNSLNTDEVNSSKASKPREVIVFINGGVTFEEAEKVAEFNAKATTVNAQNNNSSFSNSNGMRVILGGSYIHNSSSFLQELQNINDKDKLPSGSSNNSLGQQAANKWGYEGKLL